MQVDKEQITSAAEKLKGMHARGCSMDDLLDTDILPDARVVAIGLALAGKFDEIVEEALKEDGEC